MSRDLAHRIVRFVEDPESGDLGTLARAAFAHQYEHVEPLRRLCRERGVEPEGLDDPLRIPPVPTAAFKSLDLSVAGADEEVPLTFRSSGTRGGEEARSVHRHPYPDLYRATVDRAFPAFCPLADDRPPILSLVPSRETAPDSSLAFMVDRVTSRFGGEASAYAFGSRGVDGRTLRSWVAARQRDGRPALILATAFALADALDALDRMGLRFRLPGGSAVMETGGFKGHRREEPREDLHQRLEQVLGVPAVQVLGEYGMTELTSQLYTANLVGGAADLYTAPHWVRVRVVDPETLEEQEDGEEGLVAVLDLANLSSALHVLTEDLGRMEEGGLRLLGRAPEAELRGCSLTVEELAG